MAQYPVTDISDGHHEMFYKDKKILFIIIVDFSFSF